ncbi:uncharacterized protein KY384_007050 [Bacidia gigantensis]|uniref:uncharacterized protein n=1 Tax=Bacidia gigantensis TaxID=2732470 RepID=UPI001D044B5F|nr:uncharacterized protein KY384_007050 [Bacidia gigantensis]KAG8528134.1 hypothetical protein KY384_007050 [Bacidia gigantensis]
MDERCFLCGRFPFFSKLYALVLDLLPHSPSRRQMRTKPDLRVNTSHRVPSRRPTKAYRGAEYPSHEEAIVSPLTGYEAPNYNTVNAQKEAARPISPVGASQRRKKAVSQYELKRQSQQLLFQEAALPPETIHHKKAGKTQQESSKGQPSHYNFSRPPEVSTFQVPPEKIGHKWSAPPPSQPKQARQTSQGRGDRSPFPLHQQKSRVKQTSKHEQSRPKQPPITTKKAAGHRKPVPSQHPHQPTQGDHRSRPRNETQKAYRDMEKGSRGERSQSCVARHRWLLFVMFILIVVGGGALIGVLATKKS